MPSHDAFALRRSGLNEFLFAAVGTETNGMTLSVVSVLARMGHDPWLEAGRLASLPKSAAIESLARSIAGMPASLWSQQAAMAIATGLVVLLPAQAVPPAPGSPLLAHSARTRGLFRIIIILVCIASAVAFGSGFFTSLEAPKPDISSIASFRVSPR